MTSECTSSSSLLAAASNAVLRFVVLGALSLAGLVVTAPTALAQERVEVKNASNHYDVVIEYTPRHGELPWEGAQPGTVKLYSKGAAVPFQILSLPNIEVYSDTIAHNPEINQKPRGLYEEEYSLVFQDFNFDGHEDLAICTGRDGGYGSPSYNVYLFDKEQNRFLQNKRLSALTREVYLGLFLVDPKRKLLLAFSKSGCCYHETEKYRVLGNRPVLVERIIEDATGDMIVVTTKRLVNGKWVHSARRKKKLEQDSPG